MFLQSMVLTETVHAWLHFPFVMLLFWRVIASAGNLALACSAERPKGLTERWHNLRELKTVEHDTHSGGNNLSSSMVPRYPNRVLICSEVVLGETLVTWITCVVELIFTSVDQSKVLYCLITSSKTRIKTQTMQHLSCKNRQANKNESIFSTE